MKFNRKKTIDQSVAADRRSMVTLQKCHTCVTTQKDCLKYSLTSHHCIKGKKIDICFPRRNISRTVTPRMPTYQQYNVTQIKGSHLYDQINKMKT